MVSFDSFNRIKPYLMMKYTGAWQKEWFYRIRIYDERKPFSLERKELFHVPLSKKSCVLLKDTVCQGTHVCI